MNRIYNWQELPKEIQTEVLRQFESENRYQPDVDPEYFIYERTILTYQELLDRLDEMLGPNLIDYIYDEEIIELAENISNNGLQNPPIGAEGFHRMLAFAYLEKDMPYYKMIPIDCEADFGCVARPA